MPKSRSNFSRYKIPDNLDPSGICCVCVPVPDDREWIAQFMGAIWRMSLQTHYERDTAHNAITVAAKWREIWSEVNAMRCCDGAADTFNQVAIDNVQIQIFLQTLNQVWVDNAYNIDLAFPETPDLFDSDPGDAGPAIAQRNRALCLAVESWVDELLNRGITLAEKVGQELAVGAVTGFVVPFVPVYIVIAGFVASAFVLAELVNELARSSYRSYLACAMYDALKGKDTNSPSDFAASWDTLPARPPPPESLPQDLARDAIEAWGRSQINNTDNYLGFILSLNRAMSVASSLTDDDCGCIAGWTHVFDFEIDEQGWETRVDDDRDHGFYSPGVGWVSEFELQGGVTPPRAERLYIQITDFSARTVTSVVAEWLVDDGSFAGRNAVISLKLADAFVDSETLVAWPQPGTFTVTWVGSEFIDEIETLCVDGLPALVDRLYILKKVTVTGEGIDPF